MQFRLLGPLEISDGEGTLSLGGPKQRTVLAHLLLQPNRVVAIDRLIDALWGDEPPETARNTVQTYVRHLRKALGAERIRHRSSGYMLTADPAEVDTLRFTALLEAARRAAPADPAGAAQALREGLLLWRGPALDDLSDQPSLRPEIVRLEELRMGATEELVAAELDLGRHGELIPELETLVGAHPVREALWGHLMVALYRSGRQAEALTAYQRARELLAEELGIDPSPELKRLHQQILRQDPALEVVGEPLRGYRLLERIGVGAFGAVHRAFQPQVGREVAVKVIHSRFAHDPEFIRRFEAEAQLVARLEHPHIVPLYDYWREPEGAYLVMRFLRGGSLRERLAEGALLPEETIGLVDQLAAALSAVHRQGMVHRDVKPPNILFDEEGNAYLSDFGIARDLAAAEATRPRGSPSPAAYYLSPEEIRGEPATPRTDVYGLGLLLFEALAGRHPFADTPPEKIIHKHLRGALPSIRSLRPDLPTGLDDVVGRAAAKEPGERFRDAQEVATTLREVLAPSTVRPVAVPAAQVRNPYKGLRPFSETDARDFFGREALVAELVDAMAGATDASPFLAVVGPSGSGKSSVVRAGLLPALRAGAVPGSDRWFVVEMHPGAHPLEELGTALMRVAVEPAPGLVERLEENDAGLVRVAREILPEDGDLLLVIDQFEEVFTLIGEEEVRARFLRLLHAAATDPRNPVRVVVTLRADFYDRPLSYAGLAELVKTRTVTVTPLIPEELERSVSAPAERVGVTVDPPLVAEITADVAAQPGALPLLQYALTELFEHRRDGTLTLEAYHDIGGVSGALARRAEDLYGSLNDTGKEAARQLLLRLVTLGEEASEDTRRRVLRAELASLEVDREAMEAAIDGFGARRLFSFDRDPVTRGPTVEVAHEALLREWGRLRGWIDAVREDVRSHRRLAGAAREWTDSGRDPSFLLGGARLARFEGWAATSGLALTADERAYLEVSVAQRDAERAEEEARAERERALERRSVVRLRALVAVFAGAALVAGGLTAFASAQRGRAEREASRAELEARIATARELAAAAAANLDVDPERSILLALEAVDATWEADGFVVREAEEILHLTLRSFRLVRTIPHGGLGLAVTPDGTQFVTTGSGSEDNTARVWDAQTGEEVLVLTGPDVGRVAVAVSPDGRLVATTHNDGTARVWDAATGEELHVLRGHEGPVAYPAFSPDGRWLATGGQDGTVRIWDAATGAEEMTLRGHAEMALSPAFSPDGSRLAINDDDAVRVWDLTTRETVGTITGHGWGVQRVVYSPDGTRVATASDDGTARIWDAESGVQLARFSSPTPLLTVAFSPDGTRVAAGGTEGTTRVWNADTGRELLTLAGHEVDVVNVTFTPDGDRLLTAGLDDTTRVWDLGVGGARDWLTVPGATAIYTGVTFSPDGSRFAAPAEPSGITIWDSRSGDEIITLGGYEPKLTTIAFSPDGRRIAAGSDLTFTPPVWDVDSGELLFTLTGHDGDARAVAFSPDGRLLATGGIDGTARLWDSITGEERGKLEVGAGTVFAVAFSPDGRLLATGGQNGDVTLWDTRTLDKVQGLGDHADAVFGVTFGPGGVLATASLDGTTRLWDVDSGEQRVILRGHSGPVNQVAVSPDGARVATASDDGTTRLWDAESGRELLRLFGHDELVFGVDFSPDGRLLATASPDGTVALHLLPIEELRDLARERVTRTLTDEECRQFLRLETCPQD